MNIRLRSLITHSTSSTKLVAEFLESALKSKVDSESLRNTYQSHFQELLSLENTPINFDDIKHVLQLFQDSFVTDENQTILEYLKQSRFKEATLVTIHGTGKPAVLDFGIAAEKWVLDGIAEPGIIEVLARKQTPSSTLLALAAGAECAPTKAWLAAGGTVVAVMRENPRRWMELIEFARQSAGTLIVPLKTKPVSDVKDHELSNLAGIDLVKDVEFLPSILSQSVRENHTVVGAYAYSPGSTHLIVQAVQDAIVEYATTHFMPHQVGFHWLATPTDSQLLPRKFQEHAMSRYQQRGFQVKMRDAIWRIFGQLKKPNHRSKKILS